VSDQREGGVLFKVRNKSHPKGPDWKGDVTYNGVKHGIAAWERPTKNGGTFLSVKLEEFREQRTDDGQGRGYGGQRSQDSSGEQPRRDRLDDPMPF
jgi:hypothetical protein